MSNQPQSLTARLLELIGGILSTSMITQYSRLHQSTHRCTFSQSGEIPEMLFENNAIVDFIGFAKSELC